MGRDRVDEAVRADGFRRVDQSLNTEFHAGVADHQRIHLEIVRAQAFQAEKGIRDHGRDNGRIDVFRVQFGEGHQLQQPDAVLVGGSAIIVGATPFATLLFALIEREHDIGIAGIYGEKHVFSRLPEKTHRPR